jgi:hypothetical protein
MVNDSTNINKTNNHLSPLTSHSDLSPLTSHLNSLNAKQTTLYDVWNLILHMCVFIMIGRLIWLGCWHINTNPTQTTLYQT